jgi:hypothetical protein
MKDMFRNADVNDNIQRGKICKTDKQLTGYTHGAPRMNSDYGEGAVRLPMKEVRFWV